MDSAAIVFKIQQNVPHFRNKLNTFLRREFFRHKCSSDRGIDVLKSCYLQTGSQGFACGLTQNVSLIFINSKLRISLHSSRPYRCLERIILCSTEMKNQSTE